MDQFFHNYFTATISLFESNIYLVAYYSVQTNYNIKPYQSFFRAAKRVPPKAASVG